MKKRTLSHETFVGVLWHGASSGSNLLIRGIVLVVLARYLTPVEFGVVAGAMVVVAITQVIAQSGVAKAIVQRPDLSPDHFRAGFAVSTFMGLLASLILFFGAPVFASAIGIAGVEDVIRVFSALTLLNGVAATSSAALERDRKFKLSSSIELLSFALGYGCFGLLLAMLGLGLWALVGAQLAQVLVRTVSCMIAARAPAGLWPKREALRDLLHAGSGFSIGRLGNLVAAQVDYFIVGRLLGAEALGIYNRAYHLLMLPAQLIGSVSQTVLFPSIASIQDQQERVGRAYLRAMGVIAMGTLPLSGVLMLVSPELVSVALGPRWSGIVLPFQILIATLMFRTSSKISDAICLGMGAMYRRALRQWINAGAVATGALIGSAWGLTGVSVGVGAAVALNFLLLLHLAMRLTGVSSRSVLRVHLKHALAALPIVAISGLTVALARSIGWWDIAVLACGCAAAALTFLLMWWQCRWAFGDEGQWISSLLSSSIPALRPSSGS